MQKGNEVTAREVEEPATIFGAAFSLSQQADSSLPEGAFFCCLTQFVVTAEGQFGQALVEL